MFTIYGGATEVNQWETNKRVIEPSLVAGDKVVFLNSSGMTIPVEAYTFNDGVVADVPNAFLTMATPILVYLNGHDETRTQIPVIARGKPDDADTLLVALAERRRFKAISESVQSVEPYTFANSQVEEVNFPNATNVGVEAFDGCMALSNARFDRVKTVGYNAFNDCSNLQKIIFGSVESIEADAFSGCSELTTVIIRTTSTVCVADLSAFATTPIMQGKGHIYVPSSMYEMYRAGYEPAMNGAGYNGMFDIMFRKIEDYPDICGAS